jgi:hypothetical protein
MPVDVLTNRYNPARTGANQNETILNQTNVNVNRFGKIFTRTVDGQIYAQPLIVTDLTLPNIGTRPAVFVATTRNMVYASAADAAGPRAASTNASSSIGWKRAAAGFHPLARANALALIKKL